MNPNTPDDVDPASSVRGETSPPIIREPNGRLLPGQPSLNPKGRPRGSGTALPPLSILVARVAESQGLSAADAMQAVTEACIKKAISGDAACMKLLMTSTSVILRLPFFQGFS